VNLETVKHWAVIVGKVAGSITAVVLIVHQIYQFGYSRGQKDAEGQSTHEVADLKLEVSQLQLRIEDLARHNEQSQQTISARDDEVSRLSSELGRSSKCAFIYKQIRLTEEKIGSKRVLMPSAFVGNDADYSNEMRYEVWRQQKIVPLEERLARYQEQLGTCSH
jgi:hypothetical protein